MTKQSTKEHFSRRKQLLGILSELGAEGLEDLKDLYKEMIQVVVENSLEAELEHELGYSKFDYRNKNTDNSRNGYSKKTLKSSDREIEIKVPRDRNGEFEPRLIKKNQTRLGQELEEKIISLYAKGMSLSDINAHICDIYGLEVSASELSRITDSILPIVRDWQNRPLESVYAVVFLDAVHFNVRIDGQISKRAVYTALGYDMEGHKSILGLWLGENESSKFWLSVLNSLRNRGLEKILICCVDGLKGFPEAIHSVYPKTRIQQCVIHQIRNSTKFVSYKDIKQVMADLKPIYKAIDENTALSFLDDFSNKWDKKYPLIAKSWKANWATLSTYFAYPQEVRTLIYTTNAVEAYHRGLRKVTKSKTIFPSEDSVLKMLYLATSDISKKWSKIRDWNIVYSQLQIYFAEELD